MPSTDLSKKDMIKLINEKDENFRLSESMAKNHHITMHYLRWRYILEFSQHRDVKKLKSHLTLKEPEITLDEIAKSISTFFDRTSAKMHSTLNDLTVAEVEHGLRENIKTVSRVPKLFDSERMKANHRREFKRREDVLHNKSRDVLRTTTRGPVSTEQ